MGNTKAGLPHRPLEDTAAPMRSKISKKQYEMALAKLQIELVKLQKWIQDKGLRVVVIFEGRDAAGKGGAIKRITQSLNPRICRTVALESPRNEKRASGISSAMSFIFPLPARWYCSIEVGTTEPPSSGSWAFALKKSTTNSCNLVRRSSACSFARGSS